MPGIEPEPSAPDHRMTAAVIAALLAVALLVYLRGVITLLVLAWGVVLVAVLVGVGVGIVRAVRQDDSSASGTA